MPWGGDVFVQGLGDRQGHPADGTDVGHVHLDNVFRVWLGRWACRYEADGPNGPRDDQGGENEGYEDRHVSDSMIVPLASPPPSHIVCNP